jgi:naphthalene 1,2-dioxygenase ferredoxin component
MAEWVDACDAGELADGETLGVAVAGQAIALYRVGGAVYATEDRCSHGLASLSEGMLDGTNIECPLHFGCFDVRTGAPTAAPCSVPIRAFPAEERDGRIVVAL